jgi:RNA polymerase sigma-70 factor (ECF subfamily)
MPTSYAARIGKGSDGALVADAKRGDSQAFEQLFDRHKQKVLALAQRITRNKEDAEDVAQESFHKAFLHLDKFQEKSKFSTWLIRIAMNEAFVVLRRKRGIVEILPEAADDGARSTFEAFVYLGPSPEESCWRRERTELLTKAINRLSPRIRRTILLHAIEERSVEETAQILGTSISAVKARSFHGRRKLRRTVSPGLLSGVSGTSSANARRC